MSEKKSSNNNCQENITILFKRKFHCESSKLIQKSKPKSHFLCFIFNENINKNTKISVL